MQFRVWSTRERVGKKRKRRREKRKRRRKIFSRILFATHTRYTQTMLYYVRMWIYFKWLFVRTSATALLYYTVLCLVFIVLIPAAMTSLKGYKQGAYTYQKSSEVCGTNTSYITVLDLGNSALSGKVDVRFRVLLEQLTALQSKNFLPFVKSEISLRCA
jgi:hypothetical protein